MSESYILAETPEERIAIATINANKRWRQQHPAMDFPTVEFYTQLQGAFIHKEILTAQLGVMRKAKDELTHKVESALAHQLMRENAEIEQILKEEHI